ncbi:MAG: AI-2E family transporter [Gammaproteobacteria bacterium]|jgi:predicted PurR-regulated permease PerM
MSNSSTETHEPVAMKKSIEIIVSIGLIALLIIWSFQIIRPFITPIIWGIVIAIGTYPIFLWLNKKLNLSNGLAATLFTLMMLVLLITPTILLTGVLFEDAQALSKNLASGEISIPASPEAVGELPLIGKKLEAFWVQASEDPHATLGQFEPEIKAFGKWLLKAAAGAGLTVLMFIFSIIIAGVFIAKAEACSKAALVIFKRIAGERGKEMTLLSHKIIQSVINGILGIALIQTLLAGLGFVAMGIPGAGFLSVICLVLAVVQIDILIILIPLSIYAFSFAGTGAAVTFLIWNVAVGLMNNILKPILLGRGVDAPMLIIFLGAIGGLLLNGILGLFIGPVVLVFGYTLFMGWLNHETESSENT